jgi:hypothetical protein
VQLEDFLNSKTSVFMRELRLFRIDLCLKFEIVPGGKCLFDGPDPEITGLGDLGTVLALFQTLLVFGQIEVVDHRECFGAF